MKRQYDFSKGIRSKFYHSDAVFCFPDKEAHIEFALKEYKEGRVSFGRAAEIAGMPARVLLQSARERGVKPRSDKQMLKELGDAK